MALICVRDGAAQDGGSQDRTPTAPTIQIKPNDEPAPAGFLEVAYTADVVANLRGGHKRGLVYLDNVDVTTTFDLERLFGWTRTTFFIYGLGNQGGQPTDLIGDVQGVNNIETINAWRIYEAFLQRRFLNDRLSVLAGLYDINSEFDVLESALVFLNSSFGMGADFGPFVESEQKRTLTTTYQKGYALKWLENGDFRPFCQGDTFII